MVKNRTTYVTTPEDLDNMLRRGKLMAIQLVEPEVISSSTRVRTVAEIQYWLDVDRGGVPVRPEPCKECALTWEHHPQCITIIKKGS